MSIEDCAAVAVLLWDRDTAITMVAIAGAESGWDPAAPGDPWWIFPVDQQPTKKLYSCDGYGSIGMWQIHMPAHHARLQVVTGSTDPCVWRDNLTVTGFNGDMAAEILAGQGFEAWSCYNNDAYLDYVDQATIAVDTALGFIVPPTKPPVLPPFPPVLPVASIRFLQLTPVQPPSEAFSGFLNLTPVHP